MTSLREAIARFHCQLGTQAGQLYRKMADSAYADQDFSGIINYMRDTR